ncbi:MAG: hypothetical protein DLM67_07255 [Candidatus Nephthysia bennettiae]|uniref:Uncharacterized protein n=1 Tax=Candidatus Nephthysia bennettiae TaxID=3127016 RepID=A0A934K1X3_9BACT|nr:hypothetical protein [Candidatus Dormibacteraeota bacterium]MBJ7614547.1 hypothetical protein [Candidatus Dormibacteraeota bacterium]PZR97684.1 MAG: hypothetical protein DLM67_07255 [Candidatus Dormibacteraeota bacterium]
MKVRPAAAGIGAVAVAGLATGVVLGLMTSLLAARGPSGEGWSLRGNGALIVPFGLAPALVAAGWAAIVAHFRGLPRWPLLGALAGLVGVGLVVLSLVALIAGGSSGTAVSAVATLLVPLWTLTAPLVVSMLPARGGPREAGGAGVHFLAALAFLVAVAAGFYVAQVSLPPRS